MNTNYLATLGASPPFLFVFNEIPYAELSYIFKIVNHTHNVLGPIAIIQVVQYNTGETITTETIFGSGSRHLPAVLDAAHNTGLRFRLSSPRQPGHAFLSLV